MQKKIITLSSLLIFSGAWISCASGQANTAKLKIQQERYTCKMQVTQAVTTDTFVITKDSKSNIKTYSKKDKKIDSSININPVAHFQFDSSILTSSEADEILTILLKKILKKTPLAVTGYTCSLGPDEHNQTLSLQRAETVAGFLRRHGFTVATVQGKGSQNPVTNDPRQFRLNRRVTVRVEK